MRFRRPEDFRFCSDPSERPSSTYRVPEEPPVDLQLHVLLQEPDVSSGVSSQFLQGEKTCISGRL